MKKLFFAALVTAAAIASAPANAAVTVSSTAAGANPYMNLYADDYTASFGDSLKGSFTDTFSFDLPYTGTAFSQVGSIAVSLIKNNVEFSSITFNGVDYTPVSTGTNDDWRINVPLADINATNTIKLVGNVIGGKASYTGTIEFSPSAVPEPASWALMISGVGMAGGMMRRRKSVVRQDVAFA